MTNFLLAVMYVGGLVATCICLEIYGFFASGAGTNSVEARKATRRMGWIFAWPVFWFIYLPFKAIQLRRRGRTYPTGAV